jgi:DNA ligase-1
MSKINHPTLFTKDSLDNIRIWYIEQNNSQYRTVAGLMDGEKVTSEWTDAKGKNIGKTNETSNSEQAGAEIAAKYKKQLKTGYHVDIKNVDNSSYIEPMLAKSYKDYQDDIIFEESNWGLQTKYNGLRCITTKYGSFTRKGETYLCSPHINDDLKCFFDKCPGAVLDGELFNYELRQKLNEISKLVRKTKHITQEDLDNSKKMVKYYVYDGYDFNSLDKNTSYARRKQYIDNNILPFTSYCEKVETFPIKNYKTLDKYYNLFIEDGQEGGILRNLDAPYENKRSKNLLKVKPEDSDEAIILDIMEGEGNWRGTGKIIQLKWNNKVFNATLKGTQTEGREFLENKQKWIGLKVEFLYNGLTGLDTPNFARVDYNNCLKLDR